MGVVIPGKTDPAVKLNTFDCGTQVSLRGRGLGHARKCRPFLIIHCGGLCGIVDSRFGQLKFEQQVGATMLDRLKRADRAPELYPYLYVVIIESNNAWAPPIISLASAIAA